MRELSKYKAIKTVSHGITFDSKREAARYNELLLLQRGNAITDLKLQVPFEIVVNNRKICKYIADFQYTDLSTGQQVIEDVKSGPTKTPVYRLKKKLVEAQYDVKIVEVA